jgi:hypothetical protein
VIPSAEEKVAAEELHALTRRLLFLKYEMENAKKLRIHAPRMAWYKKRRSLEQALDKMHSSIEIISIRPPHSRSQVSLVTAMAEAIPQLCPTTPAKMEKIGGLNEGIAMSNGCLEFWNQLRNKWNLNHDGKLLKVRGSHWL